MAYTTINKGSDYFNTVLYTGDGTSSNAITGTGFQPDFVWIKGRSTAYVHLLHDVVRGQSGGEYLYLKSDATSPEQVVGDGSGLLSLDTDGFTVGKVGNATWNNSGTTYASWNWLTDNTSGSSNTDGSITSTVSANTTSGFSIVSYTGTGVAGTIGHGLSTSPSMILIKNRSTAYSWIVYHKSLGATKNLYLDLTNASDTSSIQFNDTEPTSSFFSVGTSLATNKSSDSIIAYCFAEKKGFSKFGNYTGNNSADGPFLYTGFKPAFVLIKATNAAQWWTLLDNTRDAYNQASLGLSPNSSNSESTFNTDRGPHYMDFVSNGFKIRTDNSGINGTNSFIYMAFAESPFTTSTGIPTTAR